MPHLYSLESEKETQSNFSPHIVKNEEKLLRLVYAPEHVVGGNVIETAISLDDLKCRGLSLDRLAFANKEIILARITVQMKNCPDKREEASLSKFTCSDIRNIKNDSQVFLIIDDAVKENKAHAAIFINKESGTGKSALRRARATLIAYLQDRHHLHSLFP